MLKNKAEFNEKLRELVKKGYSRVWYKKPIDNLIFPSFSDMGTLWGMVFDQIVKTKEQPDGCRYDPETYQVVLRILDGKLLMDGRPDAYAWKKSKVEGLEKRPVSITGNLKSLMNNPELQIGAPGKAQEEFFRLRDSIEDMEERRLFTELIGTGLPFYVVRTPWEKRFAIQMDSIIDAAGLTLSHTVDEWMSADENGMAEATQLNSGDFIVVNAQNGQYSGYRVAKDEFLLTHDIREDLEEETPPGDWQGYRADD